MGRKGGNKGRERKTREEKERKEKGKGIYRREERKKGITIFVTLSSTLNLTQVFFDCFGRVG